MTTHRRTGGVAPYVLTVFIGAFLLFQVQPLVAKYILPWFGGGPAVWTTCMLFFQALLLVGYAYAHLIVRQLRPRSQAVIHLALLLLALTQLPITPDASWKPISSELPTWRILALLTASVGLPYVTLASTSPLMQAWFSAGRPGVSPYRLYALSNVGSLLALLSYPFLVEPRLTRQWQVSVWGFGFWLFVLASALCVLMTWRRGSADTASPAPSNTLPTDAPAPTFGTRILWLALPAWAAVLLLAITNQITMDLVVIPFLWVLPLSLYLLTFIICFDHERWYVRPVFGLALVVAVVAAIWMMFRGEVAPVGQQIVIFCAALFVGGMVCHGELSRLKPQPRYLTSYYLMIALGGALGGAFVTLVAPAIFDDFLELHVALLGVCLLALIAYFADRTSYLHGGKPAWAWGLLIFACVGLGFTLNFHVHGRAYLVVSKSRNFYGVLTVVERLSDTPREQLRLRNGRIPHGVQFTAADKRRLGTGYYSAVSGAGLTLRHYPRNRPLRIGLVGLGVGTLTTFAREGDTFRIYEINPEVKRLAETRFTYLAQSPADIEVVLGDARLSLERDPPQSFDILLLDAFTGDSIPVHLLTKEAVDVYLKHLKPNGVIAILISTWHLDFEPVVRRLADHFDLEVARIYNRRAVDQDWGSEWMVMTRNRAFLELDPIANAISRRHAEYGDIRLWTDDYTSLFPILGRR
jgi:hypothetical protein